MPQQAADWGFVNRVVSPDELMPAARALAADMLLAQPGMLERYKAIIDDGFALPFGDGMALERATRARVQRHRERNGHRAAPRDGARAQPQRLTIERQSSQAARSAFSCFRSALRVYIMCPAS